MNSVLLLRVGLVVSNLKNDVSIIVGAIPTLGGIGEPTPVPGELRSLPTHCRTKAQRFKCADSPQTENIKHRFIKVRPWCSITTTNTNLKLMGQILAI